MTVRGLTNLMMLVLAVALVACSGGEPQVSPPPVTEPTTAEPTKKASGKACEPARFAPTYWPWPGSLPEPEEYKNGKDVILVWFGPLREGEQGAAHVDVATNYESLATGSGETIPVRGTEGELSWNPKFSEMGLRWTERNKPCGHYGLFLTDTKQSEAWHEREIVRIAESLK